MERWVINQTKQNHRSQIWASIIKHIGTALTVCSEDIADMKNSIKCKDLESRSRHNNVRIAGVPEEFGMV